jgi:hypothetical protein
LSPTGLLANRVRESADQAKSFPLIPPADGLGRELHLRALGALESVEIEIANLKTLLRLLDQ